MYSLEHLSEFDGKLNFLREAITRYLNIINKYTYKIKRRENNKIRIDNDDVYYDGKIMLPGFYRVNDLSVTVEEGIVAWAEYLIKVLKRDFKHIENNLIRLDDDALMTFPDVLNKICVLIVILKGIINKNLEGIYFEVDTWEYNGGYETISERVARNIEERLAEIEANEENNEHEEDDEDEEEESDFEIEFEEEYDFDGEEEAFEEEEDDYEVNLHEILRGIRLRGDRFNGVRSVIVA